MVVLFGGAGLAIIGTVIMARWNVRQGNRFAAMAMAEDPKSCVVPRPGAA